MLRGCRSQHPGRDHQVLRGQDDPGTHPPIKV